MKLVSNVVYHSAHGDRGTGDLYFPDKPNPNFPPVLLIHGGGWSNQDKLSIRGIAEWLAEQGFVIFNAGYRLTVQTPWPACGRDCLDAAEFLMNCDLPELKNVNRESLGVMGASAGGHLALYTGLHFPKTKWIVSISGIADPVPDLLANPGRYRCLFGKEPSFAGLRDMAPETALKPESPRILCTHMTTDTVVPIASAKNFLTSAERLGVPVEHYFYEPEPGLTGHGIWIPGSEPQKLIPQLENRILKFVSR